MIRIQMHIYLQFRANITYEPGQPLRVKDVAWLSGEGADGAARLMLMERTGEQPIVIQAVDIVGLIRDRYPDSLIHVLGEGKTMAEPVEKAAKQKGPLLWLRAAGVAVILFFGAMLSILYFHADVNMPEVHRTMWGLLTGEEGQNPLPFSIAYTIGIPAGVFLFMGGIGGKRKRKQPGALEISEYEYEKSLYEFTRDEEEKES